MSEIIVLGACFLDYVGYTQRLPQPGETIAAKQFVKGYGGKGANQAVQAGRLGAKAAMVSVVGDDGDGSDYIANFEKNGIDPQFVAKVPGQSTGLAMICVSDAAENNIVICPNATNSFTPEYLTKTFGDSFLQVGITKLLITQNEIPLSTTCAALKAAHEKGIMTIFNSAPAPTTKEAIEQVISHVQYMSIFCPNETEMELLTGVKVTDDETGAAAVAALRTLTGSAGAKCQIVLTLGSNGCLIVPDAGAEPVHLLPEAVKAVDTTGAGDSFVGAMAHYLVKGLTTVESCRKANIVAGYSVQRKGTQSSYAWAKDLPELEQ